MYPLPKANLPDELWDIIGAIVTPPLCSIAMGALHTVVLCSDNRLLVFGDNAQGQLGLKNRAALQLSPAIFAFYPPGFDEPPTVIAQKALEAALTSPLSPTQFDHLIRILASGLVRAILMNMPMLEVKHWLQPEAYKILYRYLMARLNVHLQQEPEDLKQQVSLFTSREARQAFYDNLLGPANSYHDNVAMRLSTSLRRVLNIPVLESMPRNGALTPFSAPPSSLPTPTLRDTMSDRALSGIIAEIWIAEIWFDKWSEAPTFPRAREHFIDVIETALRAHLNSSTGTANFNQTWTTYTTHSVATRWDGTCVGLLRLLSPAPANPAEKSDDGVSHRLNELHVNINDEVTAQPLIFTWLFDTTPAGANARPPAAIGGALQAPTRQFIGGALQAPSPQFSCKVSPTCDCPCHLGQPTACTC